MQGIYEICNLYDGRATAYVGGSVDIEGRWQDHCCNLRAGRHGNAHLQCAWDKYGRAAFEWSVIEEVGNSAELLKREQYWLSRYLENSDACYNIAVDATAPMRGRNHTEEARRKISEAMKGRKRPPFSEDTRRKMGEANSRRVVSEETKRKQSKANQGQVPWNKGKKCGPLSAEHRRKVSESQKRRWAKRKANVLYRG